MEPCRLEIQDTTRRQKNQIFNILAVLRRSVLQVTGRILAPEQHSFEETSQRWRAGNTVSDLTGLGIELQTSRNDCNVLKTERNANLQ